MSKPRFPLYANNSGRQLARRTFYSFDEGGKLVGWIVAAHGTELSRKAGLAHLSLPLSGVDGDDRYLTPHNARLKAMRNEDGLRWVPNEAEGSESG
jgi:hypothetical protein